MYCLVYHVVFELNKLGIKLNDADFDRAKFNFGVFMSLNIMESLCDINGQFGPRDLYKIEIYN